MFLTLPYRCFWVRYYSTPNNTAASVPPPPTRPQDTVSSDPALTTFQTSALVESTLAAQEKTPPAEEQTVYLNPLSVGEDKWNVLVGCIAYYEERLTRLFPPPVSRLKVPPRQRIFYVKEGYQVIWHENQLVLTESLLDPHNEHRLLTSLARALWDNNTADLSTRLFLSLYPDAPGCLPIPLSLLGIFIWIPSAVKWALNYQDWRADRELARDRFAWMCGVGETLLHQIRQWIDAGLEEPDPHLPRLIERQGQLEALLTREHEQMRAQDLTPAPPLVGRTSPPQLGTARATHSQEN